MFLPLFLLLSQSVLWEIQVGGPADDSYRCLLVSHDGYIYAAGITHSYTTYEDIYLIKITPDGDTVFTRRFGEDMNKEYANAILEMPDGDLILGGKGGSPTQFFIMRVSPNGDSLWTKGVGDSSGLNYIYGMSTTKDGGFIATGSSGRNDVYVVKTDSLGNLEWDRYYERTDTSSGTGYGIYQLEDGGYIIGASEYEGVNTYIWIIRTDSAGDTLWTRNYGGNGGEAMVSMRRTPDNGFIILGKTYAYSPYGTHDFYYIKLDSNLNTEWERVYGTDFPDLPDDITVTPDSGYVGVGLYWYTVNYTQNGYVQRLDKNGDTLWTYIYPIDSTSFMGVDVSADNYIYISGSVSSESDEDALCLKLSDPSTGVDHKENPVKTYPVYYGGSVYLESPDAFLCSIKLIDNAGRVVISKEQFLHRGNNRISFDKELVPGVYFLHVSGARRTFTLRIVYLL